MYVYALEVMHGSHDILYISNFSFSLISANFSLTTACCFLVILCFKIHLCYFYNLLGDNCYTRKLNINVRGVLVCLEGFP